MAQIEFSRGIPEEVIPEVKLSRSRSGDSGRARFIFEKPKALSNSSTEDITGMYLIDDEGELITRDVKAKFINGQPDSIQATYEIKSKEEWERFMRFMERYAEEYGLAFNPSEK